MTRSYGEHGRCDATAKSTGERCRQPAMGSHGKCKYHGGASKKGEESGTYKHGGYSKYLDSNNFREDEKERAGAISDALDDPEERDVVFRAIISDLWVRWERTHDPRYMRELRQSMAEYGFTPEEARQVHVEHSGSINQTHELSDKQIEHLDAVFGDS